MKVTVNEIELKLVQLVKQLDILDDYPINFIIATIKLQV